MVSFLFWLSWDFFFGGEVLGLMRDWTYEAVEESGLLFAFDAAKEADDGDDAVEGDCFERLGLGVGTLEIHCSDRMQEHQDKRIP